MTPDIRFHQRLREKLTIERMALAEAVATGSCSDLEQYRRMTARVITIDDVLAAAVDIERDLMGGK